MYIKLKTAKHNRFKRYAINRTRINRTRTNRTRTRINKAVPNIRKSKTKMITNKELVSNGYSKTRLEKNPQKICILENQLRNICNQGKFNTSFTSGSLYQFANIEKIFQRYHGEHIEDQIKYLQKVFDDDLKQTKLKPNDDFYTYVNFTWIKEQEKLLKKSKKYYVQTDNFRIVQDKVYEQLIGYTLEHIKKNPKDKTSICIKNIYKSLTTNTKAKGLVRCKEWVSAIDKLISNGDMYVLLAFINRIEIISSSCPIFWSVRPDEKNVKKYISHLYSAQLGLSDYTLYIDDNNDNTVLKKYKKEVKEKYFEYITNVFNVCNNGKNHGHNAQDIWDVELEILLAIGCDTVKSESKDYYNKLTRSEIEDEYDFDWGTFSHHLGYKTPPQNVVVSSLSSLKCITKLLVKNWNTPKWRSYWIYIQFKQMIRFEPEWRDVHFEFYGKFISGQDIKMPINIYSLFILSFSFNTFLTQRYVENNYNPLYITYVEHILSDLKVVFINRIERNKWLSKPTKIKAIQKLKKLKIIVGIPPELREDPILNYVDDDPWHNNIILCDWKHSNAIALEGNDIIDIPEIDWYTFKLVGTQAYIVNAFYRPTSNSIYVPLAYLQKPFIDLNERGIEYNMAFIGYTIGHEISHSLDNHGSKYDEDGNLNNWWTDHDRAIFDSKVNNVIKQYNVWAKRDGLEFDATMSAGEDVADIAGLSLAEEYLLDFQITNNEIELVQKINLEQFYIYCAVAARQVISEKAIKQQLKTNPHPLEKYRCNCPLSRLKLFKNIYGVKNSNKMHWENTDAIW